MKPRYEVLTNKVGDTVINAWYEDGTMRSFMADPANPDYQAYLNPDKVVPLTEIVADETATK